MKQVLRSLAAGIIIECSHFCGGIHFLLGHAKWPRQWNSPNMAAPWRKTLFSIYAINVTIDLPSLIAGCLSRTILLSTMTVLIKCPTSFLELVDGIERGSFIAGPDQCELMWTLSNVSSLLCFLVFPKKRRNKTEHSVQV